MKLNELTEELIKMDGRLSYFMALGIIIETIESELCIKPETLCEVMEISPDRRLNSRNLYRMYHAIDAAPYKEIISESFEDLLPGFSVKANRNCIETKYFENGASVATSSTSRTKFYTMARIICGYGFKRFLANGKKLVEFKANDNTVKQYIQLYENYEWQGQVGQKYKGFDFSFLLETEKREKRHKNIRKVVLAAPKKIEVFIKPKPETPQRPRFDIASILKPECHNILRAV